jgi:small subunit ribosomal protein S14
MAKKSMVERNDKRKKIAAKFAERREQIKSTIKNPNSTREQVEEALMAMQKLPRDASPCRQRNRCRITGRPHGYLRKFGLSRNQLRQAAMQGDVPGLVKASW